MSSCNSGDLIKEAESAGWSFDRQRGDHYVMTKPGEPRPIVIPLGRRDVNKRIVGIIRKQLKASNSLGSPLGTLSN